MQEIINITKELLKYKTINGNETEFEKLFNYIKSIYNNGYTKEYIFNNKKCLVLSNTEDTNLDVIFCTHIDVVPSDNYDIIEDDNNLYGRGTIDMKGAVAVCIHLLNTIKTKKKVALFITSDEEIDGNCVKELLNIYNSKFSIVPDGGSNFDLISEEKGALQIKLSTKGISAHSSQPTKGINAINKLYEVYNKLLQIYPMPKSTEEYVTTINLSKLNGGESLNTVPSYAEMYLDIRHTSQNSTEEILKIIGEYEDINIEILLDGKIFITDLNNKYVKKYIKVCEEQLKNKINIIGCESTSDAIYFYEKNIPTIIMNPIGGNPHSPNEYVNKESLYTLYKIYLSFFNKETN